jgi:hypothetical protein
VSAGRAALVLGLLLFTSAAIRLPALYRDILQGRMDLSELLRLRFDLLSGAMLTLLSTALPK